MIRMTLMTVLILSLVACASQPEKPNSRKGLIANKPLLPLPQADIEIETPDVINVIDNYQRVLSMSNDPQLTVTVLHRLADLKLIQGEAALYEAQDEDLSAAIEAYQALLIAHPERHSNDELYYQLAKSYSLVGNLEAYLETLDGLIENHPDSVYASEVQFRRGERLFSLGDYEEAEQAFSDVIARGDLSLETTAWYMKGWSLFKQSFYDEALDSYFEVMARIIPDDIEEARSTEINRTLIDDLVRVSGLCFNYLDRHETVAAFFEKHGAQPFEEYIYERYGQMLEDKETYSDAIALYDTFRSEHPMSLSAPLYLEKIMSTQRKAGFISQIFKRKEEYVATYAYGTPYWLRQNEYDLVAVKETLADLLPELGDFYYAQAQNADKSGDLSGYGAAASYYLSYVNTFPDRAETPEIHFLLAESYFLTGDLLRAIETYEYVGYQYSDFSRSSESAYAALVNYPKLIASISEQQTQEMTHWNQRYLESQLAFVEHHASDERAPSVLFSVLQSAYQSENYGVAEAKSKQLLAWPTPIEEDLQREAQLIEAHSLFALQRYIDAEQAYKKALVRLSGDIKRQNETRENIAASIYRQAETLLAQGETDFAIDELLRIGQVVPAASLRATAEYDAGIYLLEAQSWDKAIDVLTNFESQFPDDGRAQDIPPKLALAYRETGQLKSAAEQTQRMAAISKDREEQRTYSLLAAELFDQGEHTREAILSYRYYANTYPEPSLEYMESANRLAELYSTTGETLKNRFWLAKQIKKVDEIGDKATEREIYLAAQSAAVLAKDAYRKFAASKLTLPLSDAMAVKTETMTDAINAYQKVAGYGVTDLSTEAGFQMGEIYSQLSRDLLDSERPDNLDPLALEQYEILLEEEAFPFEDNAIEIHEQNIQQVYQGRYDEWIRKSFESLRQLLPGRYDKQERGVAYDPVLR